MMGTPHLEVPGMILIILGVSFIVFRVKISKGFNTLSEKIWTSESAKRIQGYNTKVTMNPSMCVAFGIAWFLSGVMMLFVV